MRKNRWQSGKDNVSQNMLVDERENYAYVPRFHGCTLGCLLVDDLYCTIPHMNATT
jgi:hypothetical protein